MGEYWHLGLSDFRARGRTFAALSSQEAAFGNLMLTLEKPAAFVEVALEIFPPIPRGRAKIATLIRFPP